MSNGILEKAILILSKMTLDNSFVITADSKIVEDIGLESIDFVDFVFELEQELGFHIDISDLSISLSKESGKRFRQVTVGEIVSYLEKHKE